MADHRGGDVGGFGRGGGGRGFNPGFQPGFNSGYGGRGRNREPYRQRGRGRGHGGHGGGFHGYNGGRGPRPYGGYGGGGHNQGNWNNYDAPYHQHQGNFFGGEQGFAQPGANAHQGPYAVQGGHGQFDGATAMAGGGRDQGGQQLPLGAQGNQGHGAAGAVMAGGGQGGQQPSLGGNLPLAAQGGQQGVLALPILLVPSKPTQLWWRWPGDRSSRWRPGKDINRRRPANHSTLKRLQTSSSRKKHKRDSRTTPQIQHTSVGASRLFSEVSKNSVPPSANSDSMIIDIPESFKGVKKGKGKPLCFRCYIKGHTIQECITVLCCDICCGDHVQKSCPNLKKTTISALPYGYAVQGLGFFIFLSIMKALKKKLKKR